jgi:glycosyltransferase involved in cell wall biosynthesis
VKVALVVWKLFPSFVGGTERQTRILAHTLARLGVEVDVICADVPEGDDPRSLPFRIIPVGWTRLVPNLVAEFVFCRRAARCISQGSYDVAYGPNLGVWQYVRRPRSRRVPSVMCPYGMEPLKTGTWWARLRGSLRRWAWRSTARRADLVISAGGKLTAEVERLLGVDPARIVEIPIAVDLAEMDRLTAQGPLVPKLPGAMLCVARLEYNKGVDVLIEAFRMLAARGVPVHLYVIGDG